MANLHLQSTTTTEVLIIHRELDQILDKHQVIKCQIFFCMRCAQFQQYL